MTSAQLDIISKYPTAVRFYVTDNHGRRSYKRPEEFLDDDILMMRPKSPTVPIFTTKETGRPKVNTPSTGTSVSDNSGFSKEGESRAAQKQRAKDRSIRRDRLLKAVRQDPDNDVTQKMILGELAIEVASLSFERGYAESRGSETSQLSLRKINALKTMLDMLTKRKQQMVSNTVDVDSPGFREAVKFILETVKKAMEDSGNRPEMIETVFSRFNNTVQDPDWDNTLRSKVKRMV